MSSNKQEVKDILNSDVSLSNGVTINHFGLTYCEIQEICKNICASEIQRCFNDAFIVAEQRLGEAINHLIIVIENIANINPDKFRDPDIQYSLQKTIIPYIRTGDKELEEHLINLFIDRLMINERCTKQSIIEEAIDIIPTLSRPSLALMAVQVFSGLVISSAPLLEESFERMLPIFKSLDGLTRMDAEHLVQQRCELGGLRKIELSLEDKFCHNYDLYFKKVLTQDTIDRYFKELWSQTWLSDDGNSKSYFFENERHEWHFMISISRQMKEIMINNDHQEYVTLLNQYINVEPQMSPTEIKEYIISKYPYSKKALDILNYDYIKSITLLPVGFYLGMTYLNKVLPIKLNFETFYK